jgi:hypothetical protein
MGRLTSAVAKRRRCRRSVPLCFFMRSIQSGTLRLHDNRLSYDLYRVFTNDFPFCRCCRRRRSQRARVLRDLLRPGGHSREQRDEPLCHGGMCEDSLTQRGIGYFRSITTTRIPFLAKVQARYLPASPQPSTTRSYSSGCDMGGCFR